MGVPVHMSMSMNAGTLYQDQIMYMIKNDKTTVFVNYDHMNDVSYDRHCVDVCVMGLSVVRSGVSGGCAH